MLAALDRQGPSGCRDHADGRHGPNTPVVTRLRCLRGISTLTAFGWPPRSGTGPPVQPVHWRLPWAGAHRVLLGHHPLPGRGHQRRQQPCPPTADRSRAASPNPAAGARAAPTMDATSPAPARGQAANRRLHTRWVGFDERKKRSVVANAPSRRELAGWCWSLAVLDDEHPHNCPDDINSTVAASLWELLVTRSGHAVAPDDESSGAHKRWEGGTVSLVLVAT